MNLNLKLGETLLGAVETLRVELAHDPAGATEQWTATLALSGPTPALREAAIAALQQRVGQTGQVLLLAGEDVVRSRAVADCRVPPCLLRVRAGTSQPETALARTTIEVVLACTLQNAAQAVQQHVLTTQWLQLAGQPRRIITRGRVVLRAGENPAVAVPEIASVATGWRRVRTVQTHDVQTPALDYEVEDELPFAPLPAGVEDGQVIRTLATQGDGRQVQTTAGFFIGPGALARALELQPPAAQTVRVAQNAQHARVDFAFTEAIPLPLHPGLLAMDETVHYATRRSVVDHPLLAPGLPRYRQQVGSAYTEITQHGSARGETSHPAPAPAMFAGDLIERDVGYSRPDTTQQPDQRFVTTWRYVMRLRSEAAALAPTLT